MLSFRKYFMFFLIIWSAMISGSFLYNYYEAKDHTINLAIHEAEMAYQKDLLFRRWVAINGGVYVPKNEINRPNQYLPENEREIKDDKGNEYVKINPAYMIRLVYEIGLEQYGIAGRMTSLNPINPKNVPDDWERAALKKIEKEARSFSEIVEVDSVEILRTLSPFITEENCLKCHAQQGYKIGDIRGGLSLNIKMDHFYTTLEEKVSGLLYSHLLIFIAVSLILYFSFKQIMKYSSKLIKSEEELKQANITKDKMFSIISHDLRAPFQNILGNLKMLENDYDDFSENEKKSINSSITESVQNTSSLLNNLLVWAKSQIENSESNSTNFDLAQVVKEAGAWVQNTATLKEVKIELKVDEKISVDADKTAVETILRNIIQNAVKFSEKGSTVKITLIKEANRNILVIEDNGVGIDAVTLGQINKGELVKSSAGTNNEKGTGLGLKICRDFAIKNKISMVVESKKHQGTNVKLIFP